MIKNLLFIAIILFALCSNAAETGGQPTVVEEYIPNNWSFTSDHKPRAGSVDVEGARLFFATFNMLNQNFFHYILQDKEQRLAGSDLARMNPQERLWANINIIKNNSQVSIFGLQECSPEAIDLLTKSLSSEFKVLSFKSSTKDNGAIVYNDSLLELTKQKTSRYVTAKNEEVKYIMEVQFKVRKNGALFTFINTHSQFGQTWQLRDYLNAVRGKVLAVGDMNVGYHDPQPESNLQTQLLDGLKGYSNLCDPAQYSIVNNFAKLDLFDHIFFKEMDVAYEPALTNKLCEGFSLRNKMKP